MDGQTDRCHRGTRPPGWGAGGGSVGPGVLSSLYIFYVILRYFMLFYVNFPQASLSRPALCVQVGVGVPQPGEFAGDVFWGRCWQGSEPAPWWIWAAGSGHPTAGLCPERGRDASLHPPVLPELFVEAGTVVLAPTLCLRGRILPWPCQSHGSGAVPAPFATAVVAPRGPEGCGSWHGAGCPAGRRGAAGRKEAVRPPPPASPSIEAGEEMKSENAAPGAAGWGR